MTLRSLRDLVIRHYEINKLIGEGAYSDVYYAKKLSNSEYYALKKVKMQHLSEKEKDNAINEVRILASIDHPNIVAYKEAFIDEASSSLW
jgi:NIMA (never in mitosis gene a)-related kinase